MLLPRAGAETLRVGAAVLRVGVAVLRVTVGALVRAGATMFVLEELPMLMLLRGVVVVRGFMSPWGVALPLGAGAALPRGAGVAPR